MRKLTHIISERLYSSYPSIQIVYEWEDILSRSLDIPVTPQREFVNFLHRRFQNNNLVECFHRLLPQKSLGLRFVMEASTKKLCDINNNTIPVIIDFWLDETQLSAFFEAYSHVPLILVTNKEVYELLKKHNCPIPFDHWGLSFPDQYIPGADKIFKKEYDFCFIGRPDPYFIRYVENYAKRHPDFRYVMNNNNIDNRVYMDNKGEIVAKDNGRESYLSMISKARITSYSTPGIDESKHNNSLYNQVTPRVMEMLSFGCHVIGHYPDSADTKWYDLKKLVPTVDDYDSFEKHMDYMLANVPDRQAVISFLRSHCTSSRAMELKEILKRNRICL